MSPPSPLAQLITRNSLFLAAGKRTFHHGEDYYLSELVSNLAEAGDTVTATVQGTGVYQVKLSAKDGSLSASCTCPAGTNGEFCKHCVAAGLAWRDQRINPTVKTGEAPPATPDDVRKYLAAQDKDVLVEIVMKEAAENQRLNESLSMKASLKSSSGSDLTTLRKTIDRAIRIHGFIKYDSAYEYFRRVDNVLDGIQALLDAGRAEEVVELAERAMRRIEENIGAVDDSNGRWTSALDRLWQIHHDACLRARVDPEALAKRLFGWEIRSDYGIFDRVVNTYADVLGEKGLAVYRELAEAEWSKVPALAPGEERHAWDGNRSRITSIMEALAARSGDIEQMVAVKSRDLSRAHSFTEVAEIYKKAGNHDAALEWAERGIKAFSGQLEYSGLRQFVAEEHHRRGHHDWAIDMVWEGFLQDPGFDWYKKLKTSADRAGQWPAWRQKALDLLHEQAVRGPVHPGQGGGSRYNDNLVRIFLWEGDAETAWRQALSGGCSENLWLELARTREHSHPADVIPIYQAQVESTLACRNNEDYERAVKTLHKIQSLLTASGRAEDFPPYLDRVRVAHKAKRNFVKLLTKAQLG